MIKFILTVFIIFSSLNFAQSFIKGTDVSFLQEIIDKGGVFKENNSPGDPLSIFKNHGVNCIRLRLWNNPAKGYNDLSHLLSMVKKVKELGLKVMLDFHYSDTWADPSQQKKPALWDTLSYQSLLDSIYTFTKSVLLQLKQQNTPPDFIQFGNEISSGFLWNDGKVGGDFDTPAQWVKFTSLLKRAISAADEVYDSTNYKIIIHNDRSTDFNSTSWFYDKLAQYNVAFDIIGLSYYPWWHGTLQQLSSSLNSLVNRYNKDIMILETAYPWTLNWGDATNNIVGSESQLLSGYPASVEGQKKFLDDLFVLVCQLQNNKGTGVLYWEPDAIISPAFGSDWENLALFDFNGNLLSSVDAFNANTAVSEFDISKTGFSLYQNYPNPFNPVTEISYSMPSSGYVKLTIYNILGQSLKVIEDGFKAAGNYSISFNAADISSGVYFYKLDAGQFSEAKKMILLK